MSSVNLMRKGPEKLRDADWRSRGVRVRGQEREIQNELFVGYFSILILFEGVLWASAVKKRDQI